MTLTQHRKSCSLKADNEILTTEVSDEEIFDAFEQVNLLKAPGQGGIQAFRIYQVLTTFQKRD